MTSMSHQPVSIASGQPQTTRRWSRRLIGWGFVLVLAAVGIVGGLWLANTNTATSASPTGPAQVMVTTDGNDWYVVSRKDLVLTITSSGELESERQVNIKSEVSGRQPIIELVPEGTRVKEGDILAQLDRQAIEKQYEQEQLSVESALADKIAAEQNFNIEKNEAASRQRNAEVEVELVELQLNEWRNGTVPTKRRKLKLALEKAQRNLERAERDLVASRELYDQDFVSLNDLEDAEIKKLEAEEALATAEQEIEVYNTYTHRMEEQQKLTALQKAREELDRIKKKNDIELTRHQATLTAKTRALEIRQERLEDLDQQLEACTIVAPQDGLVIYASSVGPHWRRNNPIAEGRDIQFNETIFILPDTGEMMAALRVHEAQISAVQPGQDVDVSIDARPGEIVKATVKSVAVTAEDSGWINPNLREYKVWAKLPSGFDRSLKPAMRCTGEITIGKVQDALVVPQQAVFSEQDQQYVYTAAGSGKVKRQTIELGQSSDTFVEITSGLSEGQSILIRQPESHEVIESSSLHSEQTDTEPVEQNT